MTKRPTTERKNEDLDDDDDSENSTSATSKALKERAILMLSGAINEGHLGICHELLGYHFREDFTEPITLLINSPGGICDVGWAVVDVMNFVKNPIHTVCIGMAASMAADIFVNGDHRTMGEHSTLMVHQHSSMSMGSHSKLLATFKGDMIEHNRRLKHYLTNSKYSTQALIEEHLLETKGEDLYLTPEECLKHGLTDEIAFSNKKIKRKKAPAVGAQLVGQASKPNQPDRSRKGTVSNSTTPSGTKSRNRK